MHSARLIPPNSCLHMLSCEPPMCRVIGARDGTMSRSLWSSRSRQRTEALPQPRRCRWCRARSRCRPRRTPATRGLSGRPLSPRPPCGAGPTGAATGRRARRWWLGLCHPGARAAGRRRVGHRHPWPRAARGAAARLAAAAARHRRSCRGGCTRTAAAAAGFGQGGCARRGRWRFVAVDGRRVACRHGWHPRGGCSCRCPQAPRQKKKDKNRERKGVG